MAKVLYGSVVSDASGILGGISFASTPVGGVIKVRPNTSHVLTPGQALQRLIMQKIARTLGSLSLTQTEAWSAYGDTITKTSTTTHKKYHPSWSNVFHQLSNNLLHININTILPLDPPTGTFAGDPLKITAAGQAGSVLFTGTATQAAGVTTFFTLNKLKYITSKPKAGHYTIAGIADVPPGSHDVQINKPKGVYVPAYYFVSKTTGQETTPVVLDLVVVS